MSYAVTSKAVKSRAGPKDNFPTPPKLAAKLVGRVPLLDGQLVLDPFKGQGAFLHQFPAGVRTDWCELDQGRDFFQRQEPADWLVSNPPYSVLDRVLEHSTRLARVGFAYLIQMHALTPRRLQELERQGFGLTEVHLCKVQGWYGMTAFCIWQRGSHSLISWDRTVWQAVGWRDPRNIKEADHDRAHGKQEGSA